MEFEIELTATTRDEGGIVQSFNNQLAELGGTATLVVEMPPVKVNVDGNQFYFEARRLYHIVL